MADNNQSVFSPPDPNFYAGPFSNWLQPQPQQPIQAPQAYPGKAAGIAYGIEKFLEGVTKGRKAKYAQQEDEKFKRQQGFVSQVNMMLKDPELSEEAKNKIRQQFFQEQGYAIKEVLPKGSGKDKSAGKGKDDTQKNQHGLVIHALHDLAEGLTGGKMPKGGPDPGKTGDILQATYYNPDGSVKPEFSKTKALSTITQQYQDATKGVSNLEEAYGATKGLHDKVVQIFGGDQKQAAEWESRQLAQYPPLPADPMKRLEQKIIDEQEAARRGSHPAGPPSLVARRQPVANANFSPMYQGGASRPQQPPEPVTTGQVPGSPRSLRDVAIDEMYGKRERVNLSNPQDPTQQVAAEYDPRLDTMVDPMTKLPLPADMQGWLKETGVYHPPRNPLEKIGVVKGAKGENKYQMYDPNTKQYILTPGEAYERSASSEIADLRQDENFFNREQSIYGRYANEVERINSRHDSEATRISLSMAPPSDRAAADKLNNEAEQKQLKQAETDRDHMLDVLYNQHKKQRAKGDSSSGFTSEDVDRLPGG